MFMQKKQTISTQFKYKKENPTPMSTYKSLPF